MSTHQASYPRAAKKSIAEESGRPGTWRSNVGCEAMDDPCTNKIRPAGPEGSPAFLFHRNSFTPPFLVVQCSVPALRSGLFMRDNLRLCVALRLEHFPEKWTPVFRRKCDQLKKIERVSDST